MTNPPHASDSSTTPTSQVQGITEIRQKTIAALLARGFSVKYAAKKLKISESRIYHLLSDKSSLVNVEMNRILKELFSAGDRRLINLYDKALQKLDSMLSNPVEEKQFRAIDRIIRIYFSRSAKNAVTIQQYFGIQAQTEKDFIQSIDQLILKMRKERGLPEPSEDILKETILEVREARGLPELSDQSIQDIISKVLNEPGLPELPDHKASSHPTQEDNTHSSQENSTSGNSAQDTSSQDAPSQDAPSQDAPSQEYEEFLKQVT